MGERAVPQRDRFHFPYLLPRSSAACFATQTRIGLTHDPVGIHAAIWEEITGQDYDAPADKPLTLASYESALSVRAYVEPVAVGEALTDMPLFLEPGAHVLVPLELTYQSAFAAVPRRWRCVLETPV